MLILNIVVLYYFWGRNLNSSTIDRFDPGKMLVSQGSERERQPFKITQTGVYLKSDA